MNEIEKLQRLINERYNGNQAAFARAIDRQPAQVNQYLKGRRKLGVEVQLHIEKALSIPGWFSNERTGFDPLAHYNAEEIPLSTSVPLISWVQAGSWADVSDPFEPGQADHWLPCPVRHGPRTYALKIRGESMFNPEGRPSYSDGDIVFVDPDIEAKHNDRVVVRLDDQAEVTFKQLLIEDGRKVLKALNPNWSPRYMEINGNATMCGVVIGKWVPE